MQDVRHIIEDGLLARQSGGTGVHIKVGAAPAAIAAKGAVTLKGSASVSRIRELLGYSPLADAVMDSVENGAARILCIPVAASTAGSVTAKESVSNAGTVTLTGTPYNAFGVIAEVTGRGGLNTATFRYSLNGGYTYTEDITVPLSGEYELTDAGLTLHFTAEEDAEFEIGDYWHWTTTAPGLTMQEILGALETIKSIKEETEYVHIVGDTDGAAWAAVSALQEELQEQYHKPLFFILEAYRPGQEDMDAYAARLTADRKKVKNSSLQVVAARVLYRGMDGVTRDTNGAGIVAGLYGKVAVNRSIGETAVIALSDTKVLQLLPEGVGDDQISALDEAGYLTIRQYDGLEGYYVTNARMLGAQDSDYRYAEDVRVLHKIIRVTRTAALKLLQSDVDLANLEADLQVKAQMIQGAVEDMVDAGEISAVTVTVPADQDILTTETLELQIRYTPRGKIRAINIYVGVNNPYAS